MNESEDLREKSYILISDLQRLRMVNMLLGEIFAHEMYPEIVQEARFMLAKMADKIYQLQSQIWKEASSEELG